MAVAILMVMVLGACGGRPTAVPTDTPKSPAEIANPASKHCVDQGNKVEIRTAADGSQTGYCIFADGTECEEWAYYRGECAPGRPKP